MTTATTWDGVTYTWTPPGEDKPVTDVSHLFETVHQVTDLDDAPSFEGVRLAARRIELRSATVRGRMVS